jgi:hypothetical protein
LKALGRTGLPASVQVPQTTYLAGKAEYGALGTLRVRLKSRFVLTEPEVPDDAHRAPASGELILRPSLRNVVRNFTQNLLGRESVFLTVVIIFAVEVSGHGSDWWVIVLGIGVVALASALICVSSVKLVVRPHCLLIQRRLTGRNQVLDSRQLSAICLRKVLQPELFQGANGGGPTFKVLFMDASHRVVERLAGWGWAPYQLQLLGEWLGVPVDPDWYPVQARELRRTHPGSVGWLEAISAPWKLAMSLCACGVIVAMAALFIR